MPAWSPDGRYLAFVRAVFRSVSVDRPPELHNIVSVYDFGTQALVPGMTVQPGACRFHRSLGRQPRPGPDPCIHDRLRPGLPAGPGERGVAAGEGGDRPPRADRAARGRHPPNPRSARAAPPPGRAGAARGAPRRTPAHPLEPEGQRETAHSWPLQGDLQSAGRQVARARAFSSRRSAREVGEARVVQPELPAHAGARAVEGQWEGGDRRAGSPVMAGPRFELGTPRFSVVCSTN